jgi:uncharacterized repeat protein (TIGR03803 family)
MKIKYTFLFPVLMAIGDLMLASPATAQTFTNLYDFSRASGGGYSTAALILSGNTLFGTASGGGSEGNGAVFAINTDGTGFTNLHTFAYSDGINPYAALIRSGGTLYGTASQGGRSGFGAVFALNTDGTGFTNLYSFSGGNDGANPYAGVVLSGGSLYGVASGGGGTGNGSLFVISTNGTGFLNLHSFSGGNDGASPYGGLVSLGNMLYGTAIQGGTYGNGVVFGFNTEGAGFTNLYSFTGGNDGASPSAAFVSSGNMLYGTATGGGSAGNGTVFALGTNGLGFTNLYEFAAVNDGVDPKAVILAGATLYGMAVNGGSGGNGSVYAINTDGTAYTNLYSFTLNPSPDNTNGDGAMPRAGLVMLGNTLYGTTYQGGTSDNGTVFSLSLSASNSAPPNPVSLQIAMAGEAVVLSWTGSAFALQAAPTLAGVFTTVPGATSPYTNSITGAEQFFRLISN